MPDLTIAEYLSNITATDKLPQDDISPVLKGLFGEVGSLITVSKKHDREGEAYDSYSQALQEEIGDIFWYIAAVCRRKEFILEKVLDEAYSTSDTRDRLVPPRNKGVIISREFAFEDLKPIEFYLFELAVGVAKLLDLSLNLTDFRAHFVSFMTTYLKVVQCSKLSLHSIVTMNQAKACGRFLEPALENLPSFDSSFEEDERLPEQFRIHVQQRANGKSYLQWKGVFIGDPLTDNISENDGYRFHDVFHFAHTAVLHWSPVFRALIKHKRKSDSEIDESQDSGRAIVIEEGISAYIFSYAKQMNFFDNQTQISFDLLKTVSNFVRGYEVEECPLYLWEQAILQGYSVFRQLRDAKKGVIVGNMLDRTIKFEPSP